jgi:hypothetical protein
VNDYSPIDLRCETHTVPDGRYPATISEARVRTNRDDDTKWLFLTLDVHTADGEPLGSVEDRFITLAAKPSSPSLGRVREGLKRLAIYGEALDIDFNGKGAEEVPDFLEGRQVVVVVSRRGSGVQSENRITTVLKGGA